MVNWPGQTAVGYDPRAVVWSEDLVLASHSSRSCLGNFLLFWAGVVLPFSPQGGGLINHAPKFQLQLFGSQGATMSFTPALLNIACLDIVHQKPGIFVIMLFH